ncbi:unnamed protein product [Symbiodinium sp. CCMP2456]|nr:unnamed protein product [Symbiodinium sp. CCMP2456]
MGSALSTDQQSPSAIFVGSETEPKTGDRRRDSVLSVESATCMLRARQLVSYRLRLRNTTGHYVIVILSADGNQMITKEAHVLARPGGGLSSLLSNVLGVELSNVSMASPALEWRKNVRAADVEQVSSKFFIRPHGNKEVPITSKMSFVTAFFFDADQQRVKFIFEHYPIENEREYSFKDDDPFQWEYLQKQGKDDFWWPFCCCFAGSAEAGQSPLRECDGSRTSLSL